jgi:hypothetical protein
LKRFGRRQKRIKAASTASTMESRHHHQTFIDDVFRFLAVILYRFIPVQVLEIWGRLPADECSSAKSNALK